VEHSVFVTYTTTVQQTLVPQKAMIMTYHKTRSQHVRIKVTKILYHYSWNPDHDSD